jgi:hypothetical protein
MRLTVHLTRPIVIGYTDPMSDFNREIEARNKNVAVQSRKSLLTVSESEKKIGAGGYIFGLVAVGAIGYMLITGDQHIARIAESFKTPDGSGISAQQYVEGL